MRVLLLSFTLGLTALAGCDQPVGYSGGTQAAVSQSQTGTITGVREVSVGNGSSDQIGGAVVGGIAGGLLGNQLGGGKGRDVTTALGVLGGAAAGSRLAANASQRTVPEWIVRLDDGRSIAITQNESFRIGQKVTVVRDGNRTRIVG